MLRPRQPYCHASSRICLKKMSRVVRGEWLIDWMPGHGWMYDYCTASHIVSFSRQMYQPLFLYAPECLQTIVELLRRFSLAY